MTLRYRVKMQNNRSLIKRTRIKTSKKNHPEIRLGRLNVMLSNMHPSDEEHSGT